MRNIRTGQRIEELRKQQEAYRIRTENSCARLSMFSQQRSTHVLLGKARSLEPLIDIESIEQAKTWLEAVLNEMSFDKCATQPPT